MPVGFRETPKSDGGADFFDLKKDGDKAIVVITGQPFMLPTHSLPDPERKFGKMFPCGAEDMNACPICENRDDYDDKARATRIKCYYPAWIHTFSPKAGQSEAINAMKIISGGARLNDGFMACYNALTDFGVDFLNVPLIIQRSGEDTQTTYSVQRHPKADFKIDLPADAVPLDPEKIGLAWINKEWEAMSYSPGLATGNGATLNTRSVDPAKASAKSKPNGEHDPFEELATA